MPVAQYDKMLYTDIVFVEQLLAKALDKARRTLAESMRSNVRRKEVS